MCKTRAFTSMLVCPRVTNKNWDWIDKHGNSMKFISFWWGLKHQVEMTSEKTLGNSMSRSIFGLDWSRLVRNWSNKNAAGMPPWKRRYQPKLFKKISATAIIDRSLGIIYVYIYIVFWRDDSLLFPMYLYMVSALILNMGVLGGAVTTYIKTYHFGEIP